MPRLEAVRTKKVRAPLLFDQLSACNSNYLGKEQVAQTAIWIHFDNDLSASVRAVNGRRSERF
ncbi:hypothetical protein AQ932_08680 [Burkholderia pseudomallei]|nr:hypothetical protein AQ853_20790 [Burkholderia pseudomallei]OMY99179.1 hypothetical protein AQ854_01340 [Burkholderia pseudomallei]OMZ01868.1 hypothetical protein AQ855_01990 [Burkholderia pseudomallei]OMZ05811.1 hypothetical protein AQ856_26440 [Burkholderia pseudomallei]OMZ42431.1 hypothetical protein AQ862_29570 [Burkholderia pseudomallei]